MEFILRETPREMKEFMKKEPCCNKALTKEDRQYNYKKFKKPSVPDVLEYCQKC